MIIFFLIEKVKIRTIKKNRYLSVLMMKKYEKQDGANTIFYAYYKNRYPEDADQGSPEEEDFDRRNVVREARLSKIIIIVIVVIIIVAITSSP